MLGAIGGESLGKAYHAGRAIGWIEQHIQEMQAGGIGHGGGEHGQLNGQPALWIDRAEGFPSNVACAYRK